MHLFVSIVSVIVFPITLANPLPQEIDPYDVALSVNSYQTGTDTTTNNEFPSPLPVNLDSEGGDAVSPDFAILAKGLGCLDGFGFACCNQSIYDPFYDDSGKEIDRYWILDCGKSPSSPLNPNKSGSSLRHQYDSENLKTV